MQNRKGKRIELLIYLKGFESIRSFAKYMEEKDPINCVSEDTIANAIKGRELRERTLLSIAESLELPLECLTKERLFFVDDYLEREVEPVKMAVDSGTNEKRDGVKDGIKTVKYLYDLSNRIYPSDISEEFEVGQGYHITTMPELFIYLPFPN